VVVAELSRRGLVDGEGTPQLTDRGREYTDRLLSARCDLLAAALADDSAERHPQVLELLRRLARELCGEPPLAQTAAGSA
jgi:hypothetical protein